MFDEETIEEIEDQKNLQDKIDLSKQVQSALALIALLPPSKLAKNQVGLIKLAPNIEELLLLNIDLPMQIDKTNQDCPFTKVEFNRNGNSYRSPYTNCYYPQRQGYKPTLSFRRIEQIGNILFTQYTKKYYGSNAVGSFYVCERCEKLSYGYFAKKIYKGTEDDRFDGNWNSFNLVDISTVNANYVYELASNVLIQMKIKQKACGMVDLSGFLKQKKKITRKIEQQKSQDEILETHLVNVGQMIEEMETKLRMHLEAVYTAKTKEIIFTTRFQETIAVEDQRKRLSQNLRNINLHSKFKVQ